ncbi:putative formin-like protein 18 isoform X2 [Iris pallida]|uniref:Formin-like protein 18 isoform X2 n=1 Tax=Iris pallida TaxID=29817 RepID=A0AAX6HBS5_IRIPA|nr:putative formin-like protein 18 isoform X2 [Iris pallida]
MAATTTSPGRAPSDQAQPRRSLWQRAAVRSFAAAAAAAREHHSVHGRARERRCHAVVGRPPAWPTPAVGSPPLAAPQAAFLWRPTSSGTRRRGDSCVLNDIPS